MSLNYARTTINHVMPIPRPTRISTTLVMSYEMHDIHDIQTTFSQITIMVAMLVATPSMKLIQQWSLSQPLSSSSICFESNSYIETIYAPNYYCYLYHYYCYYNDNLPYKILMFPPLQVRATSPVLTVQFSILLSTSWILLLFHVT